MAEMSVKLKSKKEIEIMREANRIVAVVLDEVEHVVAQGVSTLELDTLAGRIISECGGEPAFLGYMGFPAIICASINEEIVHGIPNEKRLLKAGDIVSIDVGVRYNGYIGDAAKTFPVGDVDKQKLRLINVTRKALDNSIRFVKPGNTLLDIAKAIEAVVNPNKFSIVREWVGHGTGRNMHEEPQIPNFVGGINKKNNCVLKEGMVIAIEPMVNVGTWKTEILDDGWTVVTSDRLPSAHFEHSVAVTERGCEILSIL